MKPFRLFVSRFGVLVLCAAMCAGCSGPVIRPQSPAMDAQVESQVALVGDFAHPYGMNYVKVEGLSLVNGLEGTGGDPPPGPQRAALLAEMQRRGVENPSRVLASSDTALVLVLGYLRPGIQKGDRFDVEVRVPSRGDVESLRGGWLLPTRLSETAVLGQQLRRGHELGSAEGAVLIDPTAGGPSQRPLLTQGSVLGGGVVLKSRSLGLSIDSEHQSARTSQQIGEAINLRFYSHIDGAKRGVAKPKTDQFIELHVHPRYKDNVGRYMQVVRNIAVRENPTEHQQRLEMLARQLADPVTSAVAALRLEAIGKEAIDILKGVLRNEASDAEVRFYAAESLAYLDETQAVEPLAEAARAQPAFRAHALGALSAMDDAAAAEALREMFSERSAETRYGAFRALTAMRSSDPVVKGEDLGGQFSYHRLRVDGPQMIHVTRSHRPEIVLFGLKQSFQLPLYLEAGRHISINGLDEQQITIQRIARGEADQKRVVPNDVDAVIRAIVELGGRYPDVVQALAEAKRSGALDSRLRVDALPQAGREEASRTAEAEDPSARLFERLANPLPDLFRGARKGSPAAAQAF